MSALEPLRSGELVAGLPLLDGAQADGSPRRQFAPGSVLCDRDGAGASLGRARVAKCPWSAPRPGRSLACRSGGQPERELTRTWALHGQGRR
jgi:hypothetical protein